MQAVRFEIPCMAISTGLDLSEMGYGQTLMNSNERSDYDQEPIKCYTDSKNTKGMTRTMY